VQGIGCGCRPANQKLALSSARLAFLMLVLVFSALPSPQSSDPYHVSFIRPTINSLSSHITLSSSLPYISSPSDLFFLSSLHFLSFSPFLLSYPTFPLLLTSSSFQPYIFTSSCHFYSLPFPLIHPIIIFFSLPFPFLSFLISPPSFLAVSAHCQPFPHLPALFFTLFTHSTTACPLLFPIIPAASIRVRRLSPTVLILSLSMHPFNSVHCVTAPYKYCRHYIYI
jgi:hypothetical protein